MSVTGGAGRRRRAGARRRAPLWLAATAATACIAVLIVATTGNKSSACTASAPAVALAADASTTGEATYYTLDSGSIGNCSFEAPADNLYVALPASEYADGTPCGSYLQVKGPSGSVRVKVVDQCPECAAGHIDLSKTAFADIGAISQGVIPVTYSTIVDPALPGPLTAQVKSGSSKYWLAILIDNTGNPLSKVLVSSAGGSRQALTRTDYNYWIAASGLGSGPFSITVTDDAGNTSQFGGIALKPGDTQATSTWMYGSGAVPPATPKTTPAAPSTTTAPATATTSAATPTATTATTFTPTLPPGTSAATTVRAAAGHC